MWCKQAPESRCRPYIFFFRGLANVLALCIGFAVDTDVFPGSSVVEQLTVNQLVAGSNPARGAILFFFSFAGGCAALAPLRASAIASVGACQQNSTRCARA